jgi:cobalt-precorrin-5B (C1)-methyltransferase
VARSGYTLPVFACAAAIAALRHLYQQPSPTSNSVPLGVDLQLLNPPELVTIPIEQVALLGPGQALAITRSDPGDNLDITRHTPIWAKVEWGDSQQPEPILLTGGEGLGRSQSSPETPPTPAIYGYAQDLFHRNLLAHLAPGDRIRVQIILPEGRALAERTSNAAFGVVDGLSLLGTSGISQPLSAPDQLTEFRQDLAQKAREHRRLVFCIGENGLDLAEKIGIPAAQRVKTANWLGPMLVLAGELDLEAILLLGYHGKLIKLAGGIFHTHHHVADGRQEILAAIAASQGLDRESVTRLLHQETVEAGLSWLRTFEEGTWVEPIYGAITARIEGRSQHYIQIHSQQTIQVGCALFDRSRSVFAMGPQGREILAPFLSRPINMA